MSSSRMRQSARTRKQRRRRLWQLCSVVLLRSTGRCTTTAPPTHIASHSNINTNVTSNNGLHANLSASTNGQHLRFYLNLHSCCACLHHRPLEPPLATLASTMVARVTSLESAPHRRRISLRAMSLTCHMVHRRWSLQRLVASTIRPWKMFPRASMSSLVCSP
jgi:hypothetical protein